MNEERRKQIEELLYRAGNRKPRAPGTVPPRILQALRETKAQAFEKKRPSRSLDLGLYLPNWSSFSADLIAWFRAHPRSVLVGGMACAFCVMMIFRSWLVGFSPHVQVCVMDSSVGVVGSVRVEAKIDATAMLKYNLPSDRAVRLANDFKQALGQKSYLLSSDTRELKNWTASWDRKLTQRQFKVVYDAQARTVRLLGYWQGKVQLDDELRVSDEESLPSVLKVINKRMR